MADSIKINKDKILSFKLPIKKEILSKINEIYILIKEIVEDDKIIDIFAEYYYKEETHSFKKCYKKESLNPYDLLFIGWSYLSVYNKNAFKVNEEFAKKAKEFLILSLEKGIRSCIPHYLLATYPISYKEEFNTLEDLYFILYSCDDHFPNFYSLLYREDKNKIRALGALKEGLEKFPNSFILNYHYANYLIGKNNFEQALEHLKCTDISTYEEHGIQYLMDFFYNVFICYIKLNNFEGAKDFIYSKDLLEGVFNERELNILKGLLFYYQSDYENASNIFLYNIQKDFKMSEGFFCHFYLLDCYLKSKKYDLLNDILRIIPDEEVDYFDYGLEIFCLDLAESCLEEITKLDFDEMVITRAKGLLASLILNQRLPKFIDEPRRAFTKREKDLIEKSESLIKDAISYYPTNRFFLTIFSDILFLKEQYDESQLIKLKCLECKVYNKDSESYANVSLENCSEEFINNYKDKLENLFLDKNEFRNIYVHEQFSQDIEYLFKIKKYEIITELYFYFKENMDFDKFDALFEIAYSLKEIEYTDESEFIYNKILAIEPENSSVLNNLAIILEAKGKLNKAIDLIKKAKNLNKIDSIIDNNFNRITSKTKLKKEPKKEIKSGKWQIRKLSFDPGKSRILYGDKFCDIPINRYEYYLCKTIFEKPIGSKIQEEDILEILDRVKLKEGKRTIYDTVLRINKKVENSIGLKKILIDRSSMVWIRDEYIM